ncbi:tyrosine-type recombinase/integrase [Aliiglaciecola sp. CAU 1673]|uniref:tyrosine-type recombinase/integrase n=1 Tax=Aliiglaciecola sp. CAU 1673 TaxID=3032595 RepID=UPI0023DA58F1|nr:tyrosine-type recombinase/integrase [Aliiglaciecola sp. CAU 1673]MDF2179103.1 tyrosine-type recombinase/integrase [Aliiglaciecola sp. CAU 1673]
MPRSVKPLNATQVDKAKPKDKEYNLSDGQGLALRIKPNGTKVWLFNYTHPFSKKRKNLSFGQYPIVSLVDARRLRLENLELLAKNIDPKEHRDQILLTRMNAAKNTFEAVANQWLELHKTKVKKNTAEAILRSLENDVFGAVGAMPIDQVSFSIIKRLVIAKLVDRGSLEIARKVARRINQIMSFAVLNEYIPLNPLTEIGKLIPASKAQNLAALKANELPELMSKVNLSDMKRQTRCLLELQLHTMTRPGEAATIKWSEVDFAEQVWVIPAEKMKMGKEHRVPLTKQTLAILNYMKSISGHREYVFPSVKNPRGHANRETVNKALGRIGFKGRTVAHGFRSLASTTLNESGFEPDVIEAALAHLDPNKVRAAYNRADYFEKRKVMMCWWSNFIESAAQGNLSAVASEAA